MNEPCRAALNRSTEELGLLRVPEGPYQNSGARTGPPTKVRNCRQWLPIFIRSCSPTTLGERAGHQGQAKFYLFHSFTLVNAFFTKRKFVSSPLTERSGYAWMHQNPLQHHRQAGISSLGFKEVAHVYLQWPTDPILSDFAFGQLASSHWGE
jgi:hypothetical protein